MTQQNKKYEKTSKTAALIFAGNMILTPLYWLNTRFGLAIALIGTGAFLHLAHKEGKKIRTFAKKDQNTFFSNLNLIEDFSVQVDKKKKKDNTLQSIIEGGESYYDLLASPKNRI